MNTRTPSRPVSRQPPPYSLPAFPGTSGPATPHSGPPMPPPPMLMPKPSVPALPSMMMTPSTPRERTLRRPHSMSTMRSTPRWAGGRSPAPSALNAPLGPGSLSGSSAGPNASTYKGKIHVGVRCRPEPIIADSWTVSSAANSIGHMTAGDFSFDAVYDSSATNADVFARTAKPLVAQVVSGFNATIFAYGTTGSGKTWSMQGPSQPGPDADPGVIPRSVNLLYQLLPPGSQVKLSYLEIYNERVYDLLRSSRSSGSSMGQTGISGPGGYPIPPSSSNSGGVSAPEVTLRDDAAFGVRVMGLTEVAADSADELLDYIATGDQIRRTSSTQYNERSSRSHAVVQITVTTGEHQSVLYLCDLAGSERALDESDRRREGAYINKSLLALSTVIAKLSQGGFGHVPYRDSKLTRLLHPSLSGHALVAVLCTIQISSPSNAETLNTLRFAAKAKNVTVIAKRGSSLMDDAGGASSAMVDQLRQEIATLRFELATVRSHREDLEEQLDLYMRAQDDSTDASLEHMAGISPRPEDDTRSGGRDQLLERLRMSEAENAELRRQISELTGHISELSSEVDALAQSRARSASSRDEEIEELKETIRDRDHIIAILRKIEGRKSGLGIALAT